MRWKANVTVAAVIEKDQKFLMIEERADGQTVLNQPAGHLEKDETLVAAVKREVVEETAWEFEPAGVVGIYLYPSPDNDVTYLRVCFSGSGADHDPGRQLDEGIIRATWMTRDEITEQESRLRSPLVLRCIDDYLAGKRYPLELLSHV